LQNFIVLQRLALKIIEKSRRKLEFAVAKRSLFCESRELADRVQDRNGSAWPRTESMYPVRSWRRLRAR
jgi:hypothetical protein